MNQTMQIETGKELRFDNVASFRKKMRQTEINWELNRFFQLLQESGVRKNGPLISVTYGIDQFDGEQKIDIEFFVPINDSIASSTDYKFHSSFHLKNTIYTRYKGNPVKIESAYQKLMDFVHKSGFQSKVVITYNVHVNDETASNMDENIIDIYIVIE